MLTQILDWLLSLNLNASIEGAVIKVKDYSIGICDYTSSSINKSDKSIVFLPNEWIERQSQTKNYVLSKLGLYSSKVYARKCSIKSVEPSIARNFINQHHIQGSNVLGIVFFGLYKDEELIGVLSLGRHNRQNVTDNVIILDRLCFKFGIQALGGASKLFKRAIEWASSRHYAKIISFSNNRLSNGDIYPILGFTLDQKNVPDYFYIDSSNQVYSKQSQKKSTSKCPEGMTELEWANTRGLKRIYDCGKKRWSYDLIQNLTIKQILSLKCARQHASGVFKHSHIRGYFKSKKNRKPLYFASSYELRCLYLLDLDASVKHVCRHPVVFINGRARNPDLLVTGINGDITVIEVKPKKRIHEVEIKSQLNDTFAYAADNNYKFKLWTEDDSFLVSEKAIVKWAKNYLKQTYNDTNFVDLQRKNNNEKAKRYYVNVISKTKIEVDCSYCQTKHQVLKVTYDRNIKRNGRFICLIENGHIIGLRPKTHLIKDTISNNKKQCTACKHILDLYKFSPDKSRRDGYGNRCKECRATFYKNKYRSRNKEGGSYDPPSLQI